MLIWRCPICAAAISAEELYRLMHNAAKRYAS